MNIFYAPPSQIHGELIELRGREAAHASRVLRYGKGDSIAVVDGKGNRFEGEVIDDTKGSVRIRALEDATQHEKQPGVRLAAGTIKSRTAWSLIAEKAVELGVREMIFFRGERSVKQNLRHDRLRSIMVSAMKQSLRAWLPELQIFDSLEDVVDFYSTHDFLAASQTADQSFNTIKIESDAPFLFVGPEGGFSENELTYLQKADAEFISLGSSRLRTETAALSMVAQYHCFLTR